MTLTCLSIRNPLSWLVATGLKDVENRSWSTEHRDWLYIHSSGTSADGAFDLSELPLPVYNEYFALEYEGGDLREARYLEAVSESRSLRLKEVIRNSAELREFTLVERLQSASAAGEPYFRAGCIVGRVKIAAIREGWTGSPWSEGEDFQWILRSAELFERPIEGVKGKLGLWKHEVSEEAFAAARGAR